jgi:glycerate kinase
MKKVARKTYDIEFLILCDVENPLLGKDGAAHVFGPQKGAEPKDVEKLEKSMKQYNDLIKRKTGKDFSMVKGAGAAGGIAVALKAFFNTSMVSGVDFLLEQMGFEESLQGTDLLITAEGKADDQTLKGKGPFGVASKAKEHGIPTVILAGEADDMVQLNHGFNAVFPITNGPMSLKEAMSKTAKNLEETARQIGNLLALKE